MNLNPSPEEVNSVFCRTLVATEFPREMTAADKIQALERECYDLRMRNRNLRIEMDELRSQQPYYWQAIEEERDRAVAELACEKVLKEATKRVGRSLFWVALIAPVAAFLLGLWLGRL